MIKREIVRVVIQLNNAFLFFSFHFIVIIIVGAFVIV
jgi:hypothetical protein